MTISTNTIRGRHSLWARAGKALGEKHFFIRTLALASILLTSLYLALRILYTLEGANPILFWILFGGEAFGLITFTLFVKDAWSNHFTLPNAKIPGDTTVLIATYDESMDVLEPTILAATRIREVAAIWVLDDGNRDWVGSLANRYGAKHVTRFDNSHAKAGNINHALELVTTEFVLILDADHVADPEIVSELRSRFVEPDIAIVQSPHGFRNKDSAQHFDAVVHEQSLFFDILLPGRNASNSVFWCGSGALIRTGILNDIGGVQTRTITEDLETSVVLQRKGFRSVYHNRVLLQGLAPANLSGYLLQRYRWARGTLQILLSRLSPIFASGNPISVRISFLSNLLYYFVPLQHLGFVTVLLATLFLGLIPVNMEHQWVLFLWLPQILLSVTVMLGLSEGRQLPFSGTRNAWITSGIYLRAIFDTLTRRKARFQVTPKDAVELGGFGNLKLLAIPASAALLIVAGIIFSATIMVFTEARDPSYAQAFLYAVFFGCLELSTLLPMLKNAVFRKQHRANWRYPVKLEGAVESTPVTITNLHLSGCEIELRGEHAGFSQGEIHELKINLQGEIGIGQVKIQRCESHSDGRHSYGCSVIWKDSRSRQLVIQASYLKDFAEQT